MDAELFRLPDSKALYSSMHDEYRSRRFFRSLDGIRCISIIAVLWHHTHNSSPTLPILKNGFLGVDMFFVLSGFLITTLLLREDEKTGTISLRQFYIRRSLRILPLYYGLLIAFALILLILPRSSMAQPFWQDLPYYLTFTSNWIAAGTLFSVAWSLSTEQQFYLVSPILEKTIRSTKVKLVIISVFILINQLFNFHIIQSLLSNWFGITLKTHEITEATFTPICLGVLLAYMLHFRPSFEKAASWLSPRWVAPLCLIVTLLLCNIPGNIAGLPRLLIQLSMTTLIASCVVREDHGLSSILRFKPIERIGVISYGMYLFHLIALGIATAILKVLGLKFAFDQFLLCFVITVILSEISFRFYEKRFLRLKHFFEPKTKLAES